jgi:hypothetical protein
MADVKTNKSKDNNCCGKPLKAVDPRRVDVKKIIKKRK